MGSNKFWFYWCLFLIGVVVSTSLFTYYGKPQTHYIGEEIVTIDELVIVLQSDETLAPKYNKITAEEDGSLKFTYDFYSQEDYEFLNKNERSFGDSVFIYSLKRSLTSDSTIFVALAGIAFFVLYYYAMYRRGKVNKFATNLIHRYERHRDKKMTLVDKYNIAANPSDIKSNGSNGIIAVRSWKVDSKGTLTSIVQETKWNGNELKSDKNPDKDGVRGIYGYRLGANIKQSSTVMGIVELNGRYEYHPDGIVRAEHCKMLGFFMSNGLERTAKFISNKYNTPVYLDESSEVAYLSWLYSEEGQKALQHNYELLKEN